MDEILQQLGLTHLLSRFQENQISPSDVINLTETEFLDLGVTRIGDRARIRAKCRDVVAGESATSPVVRKLMQLYANKRHSKRGRNDCQETYRFYVGWKLHVPSKGFRNVTINKGGGTHKLDFNKQDRISDMKERITKLFFPSGRNETQNLNLSELSVQLSNYSGTSVEQIMDRGDFTAEEYYRAVGTHPVRIYLLTSPVNQNEENAQPAMHVTPATPVPSTSAAPQTPVATPVMPASPATPYVYEQIDDTNLYSELTDDEDFIDSGTPIVLFRSSHVSNGINTATPSTSSHIPIASSSNQDPADTGETEESILIRLGSKINADGKKNIINVSRGDILSGAKRGFQRASFQEESQLSVRFSGENGIDDGGPSREFMRLALREIRDSSLFTGPPDSRNIQVDLAAEEKGEYLLAGRMIAYILVHGGPPPRFFSPCMYSMITGKPTVSPDDIDDPDLKEKVQRIADATDETEFLAALGGVEDIIDFIGALSLARYVKQKQLVQALTTHIVIKRKRDVTEQFKDGLRTLDVLNQMEKYPRAMEGLFIATDRPEVDAVQVDSLFTVIFSEAGSNRFQQELKTQVHWRDFLQDLEETQSLGKLLAFVTGLDEVPPLGFWPQLRLEFSHPGIDSFDGTPYANTCANSLRVPVLQEYQSFKEVMMLSLEVGTVFTNA